MIDSGYWIKKPAVAGFFVLTVDAVMKFAIALFSAPHTPAARRALRFAQAAVASGHEIVRLFLYQDGVHCASGNIVVAQDEVNIAQQWREFIQAQQLDAVVCIGSALRRGLLNAEEAKRYQKSAANLAEPYQLSGLGQLQDAIQQADRLLCFGGEG